MIACVEIKNRSYDPDHVPFRGGLSSAGWHLLRSTYLRNLNTGNINWRPD